MIEQINLQRNMLFKTEFLYQHVSVQASPSPTTHELVSPSLQLFYFLFSIVYNLFNNVVSETVLAGNSEVGLKVKNTFVLSSDNKSTKIPSIMQSDIRHPADATNRTTIKKKYW